MSMRTRVAHALLALTAACGGSGSGGTPSAEADEALSGGDLTVFDTTRDAYAQLAPNASREDREAFFAGNGSVFNRNWTTAPSSTSGTDGLGPTFNAKSCSSCHFKDGRGAPPASDDEPFVGLLLRLSVPGEDEHGGPKPEPSYGDQLEQNALAVAVPRADGAGDVTVPAEGTPHVHYDERDVVLDDGTHVTLLAPSYTIDALAFGPLANDVMISPRVAPAVFGDGLLEAVPEAEIMALVDEDDTDGDGISGRVNRVWDPVTGALALGRMGWKANQAGLMQQNAGAFLGDIGITSPLHPTDNCPAPQAECAAAVSGGAPELDQEKLDLVTTYTRLLAVPARRDVNDPAVLRGKRLFRTLNCGGCHVETLHTGAEAALDALVDQTFHPYTDLLLHDMGEDLADGRPDFLASGSEWRTPPLWGLGLLETVNRHTRLLHDGRARGAEEAILWHGGEAQASRDGYAALSADARAELLRFLASL
jgi:CxxC motif-containing protein (DUF1111 family)